MTAITTPFRLATGAVRRCADLQQETVGLRSAARCMRSLRAAGTRFPGAVLGAELLAMMSARFRESQQAAGGQGEARYTAERAREFSDPRTGETGAGPWGAVSANEPAAAGFEAPPARARSGSGITASGPHESDEAPQTTDFQSEPGTGREWEQAGEVEAASNPWPEVPGPPARARAAEPTGTLAMKLREYWDLQRRGSTAVSTAAATSGPHAGDRLAKQAPEVRPAPARPRFSGRTSEFAKRLEAFVSSNAQPHAEQTSYARQQGASAGTREYRLADYSTPGAGIALAGDFADRLAEALRDQAIQHGIDLT